MSFGFKVGLSLGQRIMDALENRGIPYELANANKWLDGKAKHAELRVNLEHAHVLMDIKEEVEGK